jgi:hypothetical protein
MAQSDVIPIYAFAHHFPVRVRPASRLSDDELFELCVRNRELHIERTSEGEVIVTSPTGGDSDESRRPIRESRRPQHSRPRSPAASGEPCSPPC